MCNTPHLFKASPSYNKYLQKLTDKFPFPTIFYQLNVLSGFLNIFLYHLDFVKSQHLIIKVLTFLAKSVLNESTSEIEVHTDPSLNIK